MAHSNRTAAAAMLAGAPALLLTAQASAQFASGPTASFDRSELTSSVQFDVNGDEINDLLIFVGPTDDIDYGFYGDYVGILPLSPDAEGLDSSIYVNSDVAFGIDGSSINEFATPEDVGALLGNLDGDGNVSPSSGLGVLFAGELYEEPFGNDAVPTFVVSPGNIAGFLYETDDGLGLGFIEVEVSFISPEGTPAATVTTVDIFASGFTLIPEPAGLGLLGLGGLVLRRRR
ncbi:MAG: PEP-CTERM sorting domain-containing protein [Planctomycetota bacterium]